MRMIIKYSLFLLSQIFLSVNLFAQTEKDSAAVRIDSLLSQNITNNLYISSASRYVQSISEAPTSASIVNSNESESYGYSSLLDVFRAARGLFISYDKQYDALGVRGFIKPSTNNSQILLMIDGHRMNIFDGAPKGNDLPFDMMNFENVEILKGPGSALYGTNAMLAVINLTPKKLSEFSKPQAVVRYGSFDSKKISLNWGGDISKDISFSLNSTIYDSKGEDVYFKEFDYPQSNNGTAQGLDYESRYGIYSTINFSHFNLKILSTYRKKGNPTGSFFSKFNAKSETIDQAEFIELDYSKNISYDKNFTFKAFIDRARHYGVYFVQVLNINNDGYVRNLASTAGAELQFTWDLLANNRLTVGMEYKTDIEKWLHLWLPSISVLDVNDPSKTFSAFVQNEYQYSSALSFYFGVRLDSYYPGNTTLNPRMSLNFAPNDENVLRLIYGTAFREPNIYEKYYEVPFFVKRNPDLLPEKISTAELIWDYNLSNIFKTTVALYYYRMKNLIDAIADNRDGLFQYKNIGSAETSGFEIGVEANILKNSSGYLRYSHQKAVDEKKSVLANSPAHLLKFGFTSPLLLHLNFGFEIQYESERKTIYSNFTKPVVYGSLNFFTDKLLDNINFSLQIKNLFNNSINYPGGLQLKQDYITQPQRNYLFSVGYGL